MARPHLLGAAAVTAVLPLAACSEVPRPRTGQVMPAQVHAFHVSQPALFEGRRLYSPGEIEVRS